MSGNGEADGEIVPEFSMFSWAGRGPGRCDGEPWKWDQLGEDGEIRFGYLVGSQDGSSRSRDGSCSQMRGPLAQM